MLTWVNSKYIHIVSIHRCNMCFVSTYRKCDTEVLVFKKRTFLEVRSFVFSLYIVQKKMIAKPNFCCSKKCKVFILCCLPSINTQSCIKGLLVIRDFCFWASWAAGPDWKKGSGPTMSNFWGWVFHVFRSKNKS